MKLFLKTTANFFILIACFQSSINIAFSQRCGTSEYIQNQIKENTDLQNKMFYYEQNTQKALKDINYQKSLNNGVYRIPVVVHLIGDDIINNYSVNNYAKILRQIQILNEDYRKISGSKGFGDGVDTQIEFCLATKSPDGTSTNGITKIYGTLPIWDVDAAQTQNNSNYTLKHLRHWPEDKYLNIYIAELAQLTNEDGSKSDLLGYSTFPSQLSSEADLDGVVISHKYFGETLSQTFGNGRTLTHEVGHWLNLNHTWGHFPNGADGDCYIDDGVDDTPICDGPFQSSSPYCNSFSSCTDENNIAGLTDRRQIENYMDYSEDLCVNMYTAGQAERMRYTLLSTRYGFAQPLDELNTAVCSIPDHCSNQVIDAGETGIDCGGTDCKPCGELNGGVIIDEGGYRDCFTKLSIDGFLINEKTDGIVEICPNDEIILGPNATNTSRYSPNCIGHARILDYIHKRKGGLCKNLIEAEPYADNCDYHLIANYCECSFYTIFISITEVDNNLSPIGPEYSEWKNISPYDRMAPIYDDFPLLKYLPQGIVLYPNKYYKIKLANTYNYGNWDEGTRYVHMYDDNTSINGVIISNNVYGKDIAISNSTVTQPIEMVASNSIRLLPNTNLKSGHYHIAPVNCNDINKSLNAPNLEARENSYHGYSNGVDSKIDDSSIPSNQLTNQEEDILIYPNPTDGNITIDLKQLTANSKLTLTNNLGVELFTKTIKEPITSLNLSEFPVGLYFIKIQLGEQMIIKKVVKR